MTWWNVTGLSLVLMAVVACQQQEAPAPPSTDSAPVTQGGSMPQSAPVDIPRIEGGGVTVVPPEVKGKWKAVVLSVEDKQQQKSKTYTVELGKNVAIPESALVVNVLDFLPDLKIENSVFTSATNQLNNPAVHVIIQEGEKEVFKGWLFSIFPTIHPFQHQRFGVTLKEAVPS
jgi:hypothetical protein